MHPVHPVCQPELRRKAWAEVRQPKQGEHAAIGIGQTTRWLVRRGREVLTYKGQEISLKAEAGPPCMTEPILREDSRTGPGNTVIRAPARSVSPW